VASGYIATRLVQHPYLHNLDLNTSTGEFSFPPSEYAAFASTLQPYTRMDTPFVGFATRVADLRAKGFDAAIFEEGRSVWIFFCKAGGGRCEYIMWLREG
jgi:hypothetical protein